jgi:hypothetical protein
MSTHFNFKSADLNKRKTKLKDPTSTPSRSYILLKGEHMFKMEMGVKHLCLIHIDGFIEIRKWNLTKELPPI